MRIRWLHLSDIHFNYKNFDSHNMRKDFIERIKMLQDNEPFTHLFLSGDILYQNQSADMDTISFICDLIDIMRLDSKNVIIVPGNHDHDRNITLSSLKGISEENIDKIDNLNPTVVHEILNGFENYFSVYNQVIGEDYYADFNCPHSVLCADGLSVIKLNTGWLDSDSSADRNYLNIGSRQLQLKLSDCESLLNNTINIAVGHHCLKDLTEQEHIRVLDLFKRHNIGLYLCGHKHKPEINYYSGYDVLEFIAPGGFCDGYSCGGYIVGIIDTDTDFYKAEVYSWSDGNWCIESKLNGTDDYGMYYFHTNRYNHNYNIAAVDCKTMNGHISRRQIENSLGSNQFDLHTYVGMPDNPCGYNEETILNLSSTIEELTKKNKLVHIYPLAPIPMLLMLGYNLQKNTKIITHQYDRDADIWVYDHKSSNIKAICPNDLTPSKAILAVAVSASFRVGENQIKNALKEKEYDLLQFETNVIQLGQPLYINDVINVADYIIDNLNKYVSYYNEIHLFAAIPAGLAVELGRRMLKSIYTNVFTYNFEKQEYKKSLVINPVELKKDIPNIESLGVQSKGIRLIPVLGEIACGDFNDSLKENTEFYPIPNSILSSGDYFFVRAKGDSMIGAGIDDGDLVLIKHQPNAEDGTIVVALFEGETTLKRLFHDYENKKIILHPENDSYSDMYFDNLEIQGVAVRVVKAVR